MMIADMISKATLVKDHGGGFRTRVVPAESLRQSARTLLLIHGLGYTKGCDPYADWVGSIRRAGFGGRIIAVHWNSGTLSRYLSAAGDRTNLPQLLFGLASNCFQQWASSCRTADLVGDQVAQLILDLKRAHGQEELRIAAHSLGVRVIHRSLEHLGQSGDRVVDNVHLYAGALSDDVPWTSPYRAVRGQITNHHSRNDDVLDYLFRVAQLGDAPIGLTGINSRSKRIRNLDQTRRIEGHTDYAAKVHLIDDLRMPAGVKTGK